MIVSVTVRQLPRKQTYNQPTCTYDHTPGALSSEKRPTALQRFRCSAAAEARRGLSQFKPVCQSWTQNVACDARNFIYLHATGCRFHCKCFRCCHQRRGFQHRFSRHWIRCNILPHK